MDVTKLKEFAEKTKKTDPGRHPLWVELVSILTDEAVDTGSSPANFKQSGVAPTLLDPKKPVPVVDPGTPGEKVARLYTQAEVDAMVKSLNENARLQVEKALKSKG